MKISIFERVRQAAEALFTPAAYYEAAKLWDPRRSRVPGWVRDARLDADVLSRLEIMRKARYFERNNAIVNRLADLFEEYTVGPNGLRFVPASSDPAWNKAFSAWFADWSRFCDLTSRAGFGTIQALCARSWFVDGEVFVLKTRGKARPDQQSFPRLQVIEGHRVSTPPDLASDPSIIDGTKLSDRGRPESYFIRIGGLTAADAENYEEVPADQVIHIFEPSRPGQTRGLSFFYPVLNDLHDLDDLQLLSMDAFKEAAQVTNVLKTKTGELSAKELRAARFNIGGTAGTSGGSSQNRNEYYQDVFRGKAKVLLKDDEFQQFAVVRPSEQERALWDYLTSKVCVGVGVTKLLVMPYTTQGTVVRADLDIQGAFFRSRSSVLATAFSEAYRFAAQWAVNNVQDLSDPPEDYLRVKVRPPRSVNVDVGRNSAALVAEYEAGFRTLEMICGELGEDWVEVLEQRGSEMAEARRIEQEQGLPEGSLLKFTLAAAQQAAQQQQQLQLQRSAA